MRKTPSIRVILVSILIVLTGRLPAVRPLAAADFKPRADIANAWNFHANTALASQVAALQTFLNSPAGPETLAIYPSLQQIAKFNPNDETDRLIIGAMGLPPGEALTRDTVIGGFRHAHDFLTAALQARAAATLSDLSSHAIGKKQLFDAASEISRVSQQFSIYDPALPKQASQILGLASAVREGGTIEFASEMAKRLSSSVLPAAVSAPPADASPTPTSDAPQTRLQPAISATKNPSLGIDTSAMDLSVRPQDDLFRYVNGTWLKQFEIPADKSIYGALYQLNERSNEAVKDIIEAAGATSGSKGNERRIVGLFKSFMNTDLIESRGLEPIKKNLQAISDVKTKRGLAGLFARSAAQGIDAPISIGVYPDSKDPSKYITHIGQSGLGLPDRDYYFKEDAQSVKIRNAYQAYVTSLLRLAGESNPEKKALVVLSLEKALAEHQWTRVAERDPEKAYNKMAFGDLGALAGGFAWQSYLRQAKISAQETHLIVSEPSYLEGFANVLAEQPLETWKLYMKVRSLDAYAAFLPNAFVRAASKYHRVISGAPKMESRSKRGVHLVNNALGDIIGQIYVKLHFPESSRKRMEELVENLRSAYAERIQGLAWMGEETKLKALEKLRSFTHKIGYPNQWRNYSNLRIAPDDLIGNVRRSSQAEYARMMKKLGKPVDRGEWHMTPQTVNAYYNPLMNEIVFPAAILQAPFFDPGVDDALNYGGIGGVIGHEMSHGFDDQGAKYDGRGVLSNWWTKEDENAFEARAQALVKQYAAFEPLPGKYINGELTLGENIGDLGGLTMAVRAYILSLHGALAPVIDGFSGLQRLFLGWAQVWRSKSRDEEASNRLITDYHSPPEFRVNGVVRNIPEFDEAFQVKEGDKLHLPEKDRVTIW